MIRFVLLLLVLTGCSSIHDVNNSMNNACTAIHENTQKMDKTGSIIEQNTEKINESCRIVQENTREIQGYTVAMKFVLPTIWTGLFMFNFVLVYRILRKVKNLPH